MFYKRNQGDDSHHYDYSVANPAEHNIRFGAQERVSTKPVPGTIQQLRDVSGNGQIDLVINSQEANGFFERDQNGEWLRFKHFEEFPNINWADPNMRMIDLNGDGIPDILITEDQCFRWFASKGKKGYKPAKQVSGYFDEEQGTALVFSDGSQSIYVTNMSGNGLADIYRIKNGEVCYWPKLGYGHFGEKVTMDHAPHFDHPDLYSPTKI